MKSEVLSLVLALGLGGCVQPVHLGSDVDSQVSGCDGATEPSNVSCPLISGPSTSFATATDLRAALIGRWAFCGGVRHATGRGPLPGFFGGSGVEFWETEGALRFAYLQATPTGYARQTADWMQGSVRLEQVGAISRVVLQAADGVEASWRVELFSRERVLRNSAFDQWDFVAVD